MNPIIHLLPARLTKNLEGEGDGVVAVQQFGNDSSERLFVFSRLMLNEETDRSKFFQRILMFTQNPDKMAVS